MANLPFNLPISGFDSLQFEPIYLKIHSIPDTMSLIHSQYANFSRYYEGPIDPEPVRHGFTGAVLHQEPIPISGRIHRLGFTGHLCAVFGAIPGNPF